jgi:hypothetical protein
MRQKLETAVVATIVYAIPGLFLLVALIWYVCNGLAFVEALQALPVTASY